MRSIFVLALLVLATLSIPPASADCGAVTRGATEATASVQLVLTSCDMTMDDGQGDVFRMQQSITQARVDESTTGLTVAAQQSDENDTYSANSFQQTVSTRSVAFVVSKDGSTLFAGGAGLAKNGQSYGGSACSEQDTAGAYTTDTHGQTFVQRTIWAGDGDTVPCGAFDPLLP